MNTEVANKENTECEANDWRLDVTNNARSHFVSALKRAALVGGGPLEDAGRRASQIEQDVFSSAGSRAEYLRLLALMITQLRNNCLPPGA